MSFLQRSQRLVHNALLDLRYGAFLGGTRKTPYSNLGIADTANTDYAALPWIFQGIVQPTDVLVDIGCGKGRVINWWLDQGLRNQIVGIEIDETVARKTQRRLRRYGNVQIVIGDALSFLPEHGTLFYLYNPFDEKWLDALKHRLLPLFFQERPKILLYYNCVHVQIFKDDPQWNVEEVKLPAPFHPLARIKRGSYPI